MAKPPRSILCALLLGFCSVTGFSQPEEELARIRSRCISLLEGLTAHQFETGYYKLTLHPSQTSGDLWAGDAKPGDLWPGESNEKIAKFDINLKLNRVALLTPDGRARRIEVDGRTFARTDRSLDDLKKIYKKEELALSALQRRKILDAGTGDGSFPVWGRQWGLNMWGSDIFIDRRQRAYGYFIEADTRAMPSADLSFDSIFSTASIFTMSDEPTRLRGVTELWRILRENGNLHLGDTYGDDLILNWVSQREDAQILERYDGHIGETLWIRKLPH